MTARPHDWSPLQRGSDPVPGDAERVWEASRSLGDTALAIQDAYDGIRSTASAEADNIGEGSEALNEFRGMADKVADKLIKAKPRYDVAAEALKDYYWDFKEAQRDSVDALEDAIDARRTIQREQEEAAEQPIVTAPGYQSPGSQALEAAMKKLQTAIDLRDTAAERAARKIENKIEKDEVKDSIWDDLSKLGNILSNISTVLGVLALVVNCIPVIGQALSAVLGIAALITGALALVIHLGVALDNGEGWSAVIFDAIGVATFGIGRVLGAGAKGLGLATRTKAWQALKPVNSSLAKGGYAFAKKGPMVVRDANRIFKTGAIGGANPWRVAFGPGGLATELRSSLSVLRQAGLGGTLKHLKDAPLYTHVRLTNMGGDDFLRFLQGQDDISDALGSLRGLDDFKHFDNMADIIKMHNLAHSWSTWSNINFGLGSGFTVLDNAGVDLPFVP